MAIAVYPDFRHPFIGSIVTDSADGNYCVTPSIHCPTPPIAPPSEKLRRESALGYMPWGSHQMAYDLYDLVPGGHYDFLAIATENHPLGTGQQTGCADRPNTVIDSLPGLLMLHHGERRHKDIVARIFVELFQQFLLLGIVLARRLHP